MRQQEAQEQEILFNWARTYAAEWPELRLLFHIPNGGKRNAAEAAHLKRQGVKAGVPDVFLPCAKHGYNGVFIELKAGKNKPTPLQNEWLQELTAQGYKTAVCYGWQQAAELLQDYLTDEVAR